MQHCKCIWCYLNRLKKKILSEECKSELMAKLDSNKYILHLH